MWCGVSIAPKLHISKTHRMIQCATFAILTTKLEVAINNFKVSSCWESIITNTSMEIYIHKGKY
ncbi:hypothetical protein PDIG_53300 [Penicillium digitatum PHI26]|uniref:Uncharacterized protein n=2 Tax=Penicillium digitatum TaxID=36651 RepID=K9FR50_PEND2|nr:hypothetical protein PDIP_48520 [Penicillium digitatum Pd1]EKV10842.1 hypothetical protein PDIG_53300 [Penicillium digitatum PHI26]EKV13359.1 hypothetical protein PDIP_48520 [Penicillium digitatum Pd1]